MTTLVEIDLIPTSMLNKSSDLFHNAKCTEISNFGLSVCVCLSVCLSVEKLAYILTY